MSRKAPCWWFDVYYRILKNVEEKYPSMSKEAQKIRAWKATNKAVKRRVCK